MIEVIILLVGSLAVIFLAAELFTNSVEWLGKKLNLGEAMVGSILAAVGTAMPETMIPLIAILLVGSEAAHEIGIGAILGAPFMLSTAAFCVTGVAVLLFSAQGRRGRVMQVNRTILGRDMEYFLGFYLLAVVAAFLPVRDIKVGLAGLLLALYGFYVYLHAKEEAPLGGELAPLYLARGHNPPPLFLVVAQFALALGLIILGARVFVAQVEFISHAAGLSPLVLALIIAPLATELPEKFNSVIWVRQGKDTLALGNITGAMAFQSCIPVAIGVSLTAWELTAPALVSVGIALASTTAVLTLMKLGHALRAEMLVGAGLFYLGYVVYVLFGLG